jgi:hypothetical protein
VSDFEDPVKENLPYPFVFYPKKFHQKIPNPFIHFARTPDGIKHLCLCYKSAVWFFNTTTEHLIQAPFARLLCHKCNLRLPLLKYNYCGYNLFERYFDDYIILQYYDLGVAPERQPVRLYSETYRYDKKVENIVRQKFGFNSVGGIGISERILFLIIKDIFSDYKVIFHAYLPELKGLELDIYIPDKKLAFEYQGQQHYKSIKHWGGEQGLVDLKKRDLKKSRLCKKHAIILIKVKHNQHISHYLVFSLLDKYNITP